jgi:hypothetical protein
MDFVEDLVRQNLMSSDHFIYFVTLLQTSYLLLFSSGTSTQLSGDTTQNTIDSIAFYFNL